MDKKESPPNQDPAKTPEPKTEDEDRREHRTYRKHGYRGYPNNPDVGGVHFGTGFAGVDPPGGIGVGLPKSGVLTERTREDVEDTAEEEKEKK